MDINELNLKANNNKALKNACKLGHLDRAKFLFEQEIESVSPIRKFINFLTFNPKFKEELKIKEAKLENLMQDALIVAAQHGQKEIIKYFVESPHIKIKNTIPHSCKPLDHIIVMVILILFNIYLHAQN